MKRGTCVKCSGQVLPAMHARQQSTKGCPNQDVGIVLYEPGRAVPSSYHETRAWVCSTCGYTELYVEDVPRLVGLYAQGHR